MTTLKKILSILCLLLMLGFGIFVTTQSDGIASQGDTDLTADSLDTASIKNSTNSMDPVIAMVEEENAENPDEEAMIEEEDTQYSDDRTMMEEEDTENPDEEALMEGEGTESPDEDTATGEEGTENSDEGENYQEE